MFKARLLAVFVLLPLLAAAQSTTLSGVVTDARTGKVLPGATIKVVELNKYAITDQLGQFQFPQVDPNRSFEVLVTYVGYASRTQTVAAGSGLLEVALEPVAILADAVVVSATRATDKTPTTYSTLTKEELRQQNFGQDVPFLINWTPSTVTTSDAGTGIGYTGIRIRGSDATRINVTINGIPYNDSESLGTFWVDIPDIASSSQSIQIQRGVGTSTNGAGAFGATINLQTNTRSEQPYADIINAFGSFNTRRHTFAFGTGVINNWSFEGRVSAIASDGFIDRATSDLKSYYFSGGYANKKTSVKAVVFGGKERTYQAWYGVPESRLNSDDEAMMTTAANEGWNDTQTEHLLNADARPRSFNPYQYENQVDDYQQDHYQLHYSQQLAEGFTWNTALHYTPGSGFYEEFRFDNQLADYGLDPVTIGDSIVESTDLVRRRWLDNDFYGVTWSLNIDQRENVSVIWGGGWNRYVGDHFGEIIWAEVSPVEPGFRYYFNNGDKRDFNTFVKTNVQIMPRLNGFVDLQYRIVDYEASGEENDQSIFGIDARFGFFNPKLGLTALLSDRQQAYGSVAIAHREPLRDDFISFPGNSPEPEKLLNVEVGHRVALKQRFLNTNFFLMSYRDQLVLTGELNDVGAPLRTNAGKSFRAGIELEGGIKLPPYFQVNGNFTLSRNKIESFTEVLEDYGDNFDEYNIVRVTHENTNISFSPSVIAGTQISWFPIRRLEVTLLSKYVGKQFLDNTSDNSRKLDPYFVNDLRLSYRWHPRGVREITFSLLVNNILDETYESNGYTWGYLAGSAAYRENYYYPQAGTNAMAMISARF